MVAELVAGVIAVTTKEPKMLPVLQSPIAVGKPTIIQLTWSQVTVTELLTGGIVIAALE
jgi:hypothetical protein